MTGRCSRPWWTRRDDARGAISWFASRPRTLPEPLTTGHALVAEHSGATGVVTGPFATPADW